MHIGALAGLGALAAAQPGPWPQWPAVADLAPLLPPEVTEDVWVGACCGLGHRTSRLLKAFIFAASRGRRVVVDWNPCGKDVPNLWVALFRDWPEVRAARRPRKELLRLAAPGCGKEPGGWLKCAEARGNIITNGASLTWRPPNGMRGRLAGPLLGAPKEWGLDVLAPGVFPYAEHFAAHLAHNLREPFRRDLRRFAKRVFVIARGIFLLSFR